MQVTLENRLADRSQKSWVSVGLPDLIKLTSGVLVVGGNREFPVIVDDRELHILATLEARERVTGSFKSRVNSDVDSGPFTFHPYVSYDPFQLVPSFSVDGFNSDPFNWIANGGPLVGPSITIESSNVARMRFHFRTRIVEVNLNIEGWLTAYSNQSWVEYIVRLSWGTTAGEGKSRRLGSVSMFTGEECHVDWRIRKGLHQPMWRNDIRKWETELAIPNDWLRCRTVEVYGALLCRPSWITVMPPLLSDQIARTQGPICGIVNPSDWKNKFGALAIPIPGSWASGEQSRRISSLFSRLQVASNEYETRLYAQPPNSGQTGEQADFGATRAEHAIAINSPEPWSLYDLRYSVQAWMLRPYANREVNGDPILASAHPRAATINLRPDERFYNRYPDTLGWPNPVGWISGYTTSDGQHRSDNLLYAMYLLTRDPSIKRTILDMIELEKMSLDSGPPTPGSGIGSPRGWGRPLLAHCHALSCGFSDFEPMIRETVRRMDMGASYKRLPNDVNRTVKVLSDRESKYGWVNIDGSSIRAWLPWQESIAVMGLYAAWKMLNIFEARELCIVVGKTIASHGFFFNEGTRRWHYCYAVRWRTDVEGVPLPVEAYNLNQPNYDVFVTGATQRWAIPALKILVELEPNAPESNRARQILSNFTAQNWDDACWWAI